MTSDPRIARLITLVVDAPRPPPGGLRIVLAVVLGVLCHSLFAASVLTMLAAMFFGTSGSLGKSVQVKLTGPFLPSQGLSRALMHP